MKFQLTLIKNPAGTYSFVGSVPVKLGMCNKDGSMLTDSQAEQVARANCPALIAKSRAFKTPKDAFRAAVKLGIKVSEIAFNEEIG